MERRSWRNIARGSSGVACYSFIHLFIYVADERVSISLSEVLAFGSLACEGNYLARVLEFYIASPPEIDWRP
jgi:hypothetical protein